MWRYQKLGFESLLLAELQKQQQCNQFCDTLLKTEDVSVPAHSCVLSAISPSISSALSSAPPPPAGRRRLLEFQAFDSSTLLHIVRLLYSGEMVGEGEREKQEVISAAAQLGIHGLVEVEARGGRGRCEQREGSHAEVGVQTEPQMLEESEGREGRWRREVRGGSTFLWRERLAGGEKDSWTQTEEQQPNMAPPAPSGASYETIDIAALQSFGQTDPNLLSYIPMPLVYHLDENPPTQASSALVVSEPTTAGHTSVAEVEQPYPSTHLPSFSRHATSYEPQSWWPAGDVSATDEWEEDRIEQFEGNIPGFINHFLNPDTQESSRRGRGRGRRKQRARGAQTGERKPRQPRAARGSRRGGLTQTVDVQDVGVSRLQKLFLQRSGRRVFMTGQGGGAVGRKLFMKTREILKSAKSSQRRRGRGKMWDFNQNVDLQPWRGGGAGAGSSQRSQSDVTTSRPRRPQAKATTPLSFSSPPTRIHSVHTMSASRPSLQASPAPSLHSPAASCVRPAPSLLRSNPVIPPAPPLPEEHPETFDRLLEEVMMGLDILPSTSKASYSQPAPRSSGSSSAAASCGNASAQKRQQGQTTELQEGGQSSTQAVSVSRETGGSGSAASEGPVQRQQTRAELSDMLENFLLSFEQQVANEEAEINTDASSRRSRTPEQQQQRRDEVEPQRRCSQAGRPSAHRAGTVGKAATRSEPKKRKRRRTAQHLLSLEKKRNRVRSPAPLSGALAKLLPGQGNKQLQQMPVVKLERNGLLPGSVKLTGHSCRSLEGENPAAAKARSSSGEFPQGRKCTKTPTAWWTTKTYPIRSRFRQVNVDCQPFLEESPPQQRSTPATKASNNPDRPKAGRPRKNPQVPIFSEGKTLTVPIHPQPVVLSCSEEQLEESPERREQEVPEQAQEEAGQRGEKRGAEQEEALTDDNAVAKKVCFEPPPTSECADFASAAAEMENVIDVETVSLSSVAECLRGEDLKLACAEFPPGDAGESSAGEELESSGSETIDVEEEEREDAGRDPSRAATQSSIDSDNEVDEVNEVIDVIGGSSPAPDPVVICWTDTSEEETEAGNEDIDVGENADYDSASAFAARKVELMPTNYQTEVLLL